MYDQRPPDSFSSPYGPGIEEETMLDKIRYFWEDHGKTIIVLIILLVVGYVAYDFFIGSYHTISFSVKNNENETIDDAEMIITKAVESKPVYSGSVKSQSLKNGSYTVEVTASGYKDKSADCTVEKEGDSCTIVLDKALATKIVGTTDFPAELYLNQTATGTITLQNTGSKTEAIELVFEGDFTELLSKNFSIKTNPASISIPGGQSLQVQLDISIPSSLVLKNRTQGDTKKGKIRIKYTNPKASSSAGTLQEISFKLLPEADIALSPKKIEKTLTAGNTNFDLGKIRIQNKGKISAKNIRLSVELDSTTPAQKEWFTFDMDTIAELDAGASQEIQFYINAPPSPDTVQIAGKSHVVAKGETWEQKIPLDITVTGATANLTATLSVSSTSPVQVQKQQGSDEYQPVIKKITIKNTGAVAIQNIDVVVKDVACRADYILFDEGSSIASLDASNFRDITFKVKAPSTAPIGTERTCPFEVQYDDPYTQAPKAIQPTPTSVRIKTAQ